MNNFEHSYLGSVNYEESVDLQNDLHTLCQKTQGSYIIGLEHPAVMTLGYRAQASEEIYEAGLPLAKSTRGGLATIHSEGQLVIYPILNLRNLGLGARDYVQLLLETTQTLLKELGIESCIDSKAVGLYTSKGKIAFCGIQIRGGISQHGLSLNVRNDLSLFSRIRACGIENPQFDSLESYSVSHTLGELYGRWVEIFKEKLI